MSREHCGRPRRQQEEAQVLTGQRLRGVSTRSRQDSTLRLRRSKQLRRRLSFSFSRRHRTQGRRERERACLGASGDHTWLVQWHQEQTPVAQPHSILAVFGPDPCWQVICRLNQQELSV